MARCWTLWAKNGSRVCADGIYKAGINVLVHSIKTGVGRTIGDLRALSMLSMTWMNANNTEMSRPIFKQHSSSDDLCLKRSSHDPQETLNSCHNSVKVEVLCLERDIFFQKIVRRTWPV